MTSKSPVSRKLWRFTATLVDNRVLDLYLKALGITTLTTATVLPFALLLGRDAFRVAVENIKENRLGQSGGVKLPILDDPLVGNFLKLSGLSAISFTPTTLVPLGVLMVIWHMWSNRKQRGGSVKRQSGGRIGRYIRETYKNRVLDIYLKALGITTLNTAVMVPFALLLGRDAFQFVVTDEVKGKGRQTGGKILIPKNLPVIDDPLLGNYLKLAGLSVIELSATTMIPLALAMVLYHVYARK
jgi:hypothetical protein